MAGKKPDITIKAPDRSRSVIISNHRTTSALHTGSVRRQSCLLIGGVERKVWWCAPGDPENYPTATYPDRSGWWPRIAPGW